MTTANAWLYIKEWKLSDGHTWHKIGITNNPKRRDAEQNVLPIPAVTLRLVRCDSMAQAAEREKQLLRHHTPHRVRGAGNRELLTLSPDRLKGLLDAVDSWDHAALAAMKAAAEQARLIEAAEQTRRREAFEQGRRRETAEQARLREAAEQGRRREASEQGRRRETAEQARLREAAEQARRGEAAEQERRVEVTIEPTTYAFRQLEDLVVEYTMKSRPDKPEPKRESLWHPGLNAEMARATAERARIAASTIRHPDKHAEAVRTTLEAAKTNAEKAAEAEPARQEFDRLRSGNKAPRNHPAASLPDHQETLRQNYEAQWARGELEIPPLRRAFRVLGGRRRPEPRPQTTVGMLGLVAISLGTVLLLHFLTPGGPGPGFPFHRFDGPWRTTPTHLPLSR